MFALCVMSAMAQGKQSMPLALESGWTLRAQSQFIFPQSAVYNPLDGAVYVLELDSSSNGLHRIDPDLTITFVAGLGGPTALAVDDRDGDLFASDVWDGRIRRLGAGDSSFTTWINEFGSSTDDDPIGMAIAPRGFQGPVVTEGQALVVDGGYNQSTGAIWKWDPEVPEGELFVVGLESTMLRPFDVAFGRSHIYVLDYRDGLSADVYRLEAGGFLSQLPEPIEFPTAAGIEVDPITQDILLCGNDGLYRVAPETGAFVRALQFPTPAGSANCGIDISPDGQVLVLTHGGTGDVFIYDRDVISSNDPANALPAVGSLSQQLSALNSTPPVYVPQSWQDVARKRDDHGLSNFQCLSSGIASASTPLVESVPPSNLYHNQWESDTQIQVFDEVQGLVLPSDLTVDLVSPAGASIQSMSDVPTHGTVLPAGTVVNSHLLHFDTVGSHSVTLSGGSVTFGTPIQALLLRGTRISATDGSLGLPGTTYSTGLTQRDFEFNDPEDWLTVSADGRTLTVSSLVMNWLDELRVLTEAPIDPMTQPFVSTSQPLLGVDEVTLDNCSSAWYRFTFDLPVGAKSPRLQGVANVDDQGVLFLNGQPVSGLMTEPGCDPADPYDPADPCFAMQDTGSDGVDGLGKPILTAPTADEFFVDDETLFVTGENELVFAVCGDASAYEPTGLEFQAVLFFDPPSTTYCVPKTDTVGCAPLVSSTGAPSANSSSPFTVDATGVQNNKPGILFYGFGENSVPWQGGTLCVQGPIRRTPVQVSGGSAAGADCTGSYSFDFNAWAQSGVDANLIPGTLVFAQYWYRDPADAFGSGTSNGLRFELGL